MHINTHTKHGRDNEKKKNKQNIIEDSKVINEKKYYVVPILLSATLFEIIQWHLFSCYFFFLFISLAVIACVMDFYTHTHNNTVGYRMLLLMYAFGLNLILFADRNDEQSKISIWYDELNLYSII